MMRHIETCGRFQECAELKTDSIIKIKDEKAPTLFYIRNTDNAPIYKIKLDGDLIAQENTQQKRCDFIANKKGTSVILLIELKGRSAEGAPEQFESSKNYISQYLSTCKHQYRSILVFTGADLKRQEMRQKGIKTYRPGQKVLIDKLMEPPILPPTKKKKLKQRAK